MWHHDLDTLRTSLRKTQPHIYFLSGFTALSDLRRGLYSSIERHLCRIQTCSTTHVTFACMFNHLQHNQLASTLGQIIWLDLASTRGQGLLMQHCISSSHLIGTSQTSIHPGSYRPLDSLVSMLHLRHPFRITGALSNLQHMGWGVISAHPCRLVLFLKNAFQKKSFETLVLKCSPSL